MRKISFLLAFAFSAAHAAQDAGEAIYLRGVTSSGAPLVGQREGGIRMEGADAACVNCHRKSGYGSKEGRIVVPPAAGRYLLKTKEQYLPYVETMRLANTPYDEASLARAIRDGVDAKGRALNYLMPRFQLSDADMAALIAYLKGIDSRPPPGVSDSELSFATIVTPDADPVEKKGALDVLERFFADRNRVQFAPTPAMRTSRKTSWVRGMFMVNRKWRLHVWTLHGPPSGWRAELDRYFSHDPVLAVISGVGGGNWLPVHEFCEKREVPCLFPNVAAPPAQADHDFYSLYFSRGVRLEADLLAERIGNSRPQSVAQIYRKNSAGEAGAKEFARKIAGVEVKSIAAGSDFSSALKKAKKADALVLWLSPKDISKLGSVEDAPTKVYMSGIMGGLEFSPLPAAWRSRTEIVYPFDLPEKRVVMVDYALGWLRIRNVPIVSLRVQADTYLACTLVSETLNEMADNFSPDYLVERIQDNIDHRIVTGFYPHLALAPDQRFASKGGYFVHFAKPQGSQLAADSGWLVP